MSRCQHCNKLTHSEDLIVEYDSKDQGKINELMSLEFWQSAYLYMPDEPEEMGKLKCGDIWIHFVTKKPD